MEDATISAIERWLQECAQTSQHTDADDGGADSTDSTDQDRPFWPYLESDDFWRE